jgi:HAD superfamily phosphatase
MIPAVSTEPMNPILDLPPRSANSRTLKKAKRHAAATPQLIIFDVDGVLVDVCGSFHSTTLETVRFFTGKRVSRAELHNWKNQSGFNDDWKLSTAWVQSLGGKFEYEEVKRKFVELYWGEDGRGNVAREKWLLPNVQLRRMAKLAELAIFTGRTRKELDHTLEQCRVGHFFKSIVTVEDVSRPKPDAEGLLKILNKRDPRTAIYVGDNVDDALASQSAGIPFLGIAFGRGEARRQRADLLKSLGALAILSDVTALERWLTTRQPAGSSAKK